MELQDLLIYLTVLASVLYTVKLIYTKRYLTFNDDIDTLFFSPIRPAPGGSGFVLRLQPFFSGQHGTVYRTVHWMFPSMATVIVGDPNLLRELFASKSWALFQRGPPKSPYSEGFISLENGKLWQDVRAMFERTFSTPNVRKLVPILLENRAVFMQALESAAGKGPVNIFPLFNHHAFDVITRLVFGTEIRAQTTELGASYCQTFESWQRHTSMVSRAIMGLGPWLGGLLSKKAAEQQKRDGDRMWALLKTEKERIERRNEPRESILDYAYEIAMSEKMPTSMGDADLTKAIMSLLFAGHDTTTSTLSFMAYELSKRPDVQARIRKELANCSLDSLDDLEKCPLLNSAIRESLRLYPAAPFGTGRMIFEDFELAYTGIDGSAKRIKFRKGDRVFPYIYGVQRLEQFWKDAEVWNPERFLEENGGSQGGLFSYLPFGNGPRRCAGERLAMAEIRLTMASLLSKYELVHVPETDWKFKEVFIGTIRPERVMVTLVPVK